MVTAATIPYGMEWMEVMEQVLLEVFEMQVLELMQTLEWMQVLLEWIEWMQVLLEWMWV